jgi:DNA-binding NtrC family response regulator
MSRERVLLVDDEEDFLESLSQRLEHRGMRVSARTSAPEGLEALARGEFDAVVLDLRMPGMDGLEALRLIREKRPEMRVIILTGQGTVESGVEAMKLGAAEFVEKPADIERLSELIRKAGVDKLLLVEESAEGKVRNLMSRKGW